MGGSTNKDGSTALMEAVEGWFSSSDAGQVAEGFDRLVATWGMEDVLCALAEKHCYQQDEVARKMLQTDCFRSIARPEGKRLTIAYYYFRASNGGAQKVAVELCNMWVNMVDEHGEPLYRVVLITDEGPTRNEYPLDARVRRAFLPDHRSVGRGGFRSRYEKWQTILDTESIDIVVSGHWTQTNSLWDMLSVKSHRSRPAYIMHDHNFTLYPYGDSGCNANGLLYQYQLCDGVVVLSETDESFVGHFSANTRCIPNPISYVAANSSNAAREAHSIVWTGRIQTPKHPMDLVYMMERVVEQIPDARLYMVGKENESLEKDLRDEILRKGLGSNVILVGFTTDVDTWYRKASVAVCASDREGFPMTLLEELSYSLPIVMYDLPWLTFVKDGRGIEVVEQGRYDLLAQKVVELLEDPSKAQKLGAEGRNQVDDLLKIDVAACWNAVFENISPDAIPKTWDSDERILFQYLSEYQERIRRELNNEAAYTHQLFELLAARVDVKDTGGLNNDVEVLELSDPEAAHDVPAWFRDGEGTGHVLKSVAGSLDVKLRCIGDGELSIVLRGQDVKGEDGSRVPVWIDYTSFAVDGRELLGGTRAVWHDRPFRHRMPVMDGQVVEVSLAWHSHDEAGLEAEKDRADALNSQIKALKGENASLQKAEKKQEKELAAAEKELAAAEDEVLALRSSNSWKVGRFITWLPRKIKGWLRR